MNWRGVLLTICLTLAVGGFNPSSFGDTKANIYNTAVSQQDPQKAEVVINAPNAVKVGSLIKIDLSESIGGGFDFAVEPDPPGLQVFNDGKIIVCGTGAKDVVYTFSISCALGGDSDIAIHKVTITGGQTPGPPLAPGENIVDKVKGWAETVESDTKREDALKLAQSFSSVAIVIDQGTFNTAEELVRATSTSNRDALGTKLRYWTPLLDALMRELQAMSQIGRLSTVQAHSQVWKDMATGLREYASSIE